MARPKKEPAADKQIVLNYHDYMNMANFLAQHLMVQQGMASRAMQAASSQLGAINATLQQVQTNTRNALQLSSINENAVSEAFPFIQNLLKMDNSLIGEPSEGLGDMQLPPPPVLQQMKPIKQRKPRKPKDPNAPKRPVTAFFLYLAENKDAMQKQMPDAKPGEIQDRNKDMWNSLSEEKQEKYKRKYREHFEQYKKEVEEYKKRGGQVEPEDLQPEDPVQIPAVTQGKDESSSEEENSSSDESSDDEPAPPPPPPVAPVATKAPKAKPAKEANAAPKKKHAEKESSPEKKKKRTKAEAGDDEAPKKKRKAEGEAETGGKTEKKKKKKSLGYAGNADDY